MWGGQYVSSGTGWWRTSVFFRLTSILKSWVASARWMLRTAGDYLYGLQGRHRQQKVALVRDTLGSWREHVGAASWICSHQCGIACKCHHRHWDILWLVEASCWRRWWRELARGRRLASPHWGSFWSKRVSIVRYIDFVHYSYWVHLFNSSTVLGVSKQGVTCHKQCFYVLVSFLTPTVMYFHHNFTLGCLCEYSVSLALNKPPTSTLDIPTSTGSSYCSIRVTTLPREAQHYGKGSQWS